jgi:predicted PhzF superfamily epimerase YddE/YHI9
MRFRIFQVDAFADRPFRGNPAAVCPLEEWPGDDLLQAVAAENNLSETAFLVRDGDRFELRWFTPEAEVDLCGHATLAAGFVVLRLMEGHREAVVFETASGELTVRRRGELLAMDFPAVPPEPCADPPPGLAAGLGRSPDRVLRAKDWLAVYPEADDVEALGPGKSVVRGLDLRGVIATAPARTPGADGGPASAGEQGREGGAGSGAREAAARRDEETPPADFVSRFFAPKVGVPEDPVTGSAHCTLAPYWSGRLGRSKLLGRQLSRRGGEVRCEVRGGRVVLSGRAALYMEGRARV